MFDEMLLRQNDEHIRIAKDICNELIAYEKRMDGEQGYYLGDTLAELKHYLDKYYDIQKQAEFLAREAAINEKG